MDFPERDKYERRLARELAKLGGTHLDTVMAAIVAGGIISEGVYKQIYDDLVALLRPQFAEVATVSAGLLSGSAEVGGLVAPTELLAIGASDWSAVYTPDIVKLLTDRNRQVINKVLNYYFQHNFTIGEVEDNLIGIFGPKRAETVAITEITGAYSEGQRISAALISLENDIELVAVWNTNRDALVCPICGPRNFTRQGTEWDEQPPAHPRCRCWITYEVIDES